MWTKSARIPPVHVPAHAFLDAFHDYRVFRCFPGERLLALAITDTLGLGEGRPLFGFQGARFRVASQGRGHPELHPVGLESRRPGESQAAGSLVAPSVDV